MSEKIKENEQQLQNENEMAEEVADTGVEDAGGAEDVEVRDVELELASALEEVASLKDRMLRLAADSENFKKRMERERIAGLKYAGEQIFREMLPVVDNLERAIGLSGTDAATPEKSSAALLEGVQLTLKSLVNTLEKFEVKPIESVGQPFDPNRQEALTMEASETVPAGHVITEFEKGYYYKDRLLRPARVVVSSGKPAAQQ
ncbi:MAG: nucleotide exchange factor GrpE [Desulfobulbaceae bacterium]|nr:MAG: nucleotide exchange factor GrpE [Desulfobulbaceae bacterium]